jgi:hypothetical protein
MLDGKYVATDPAQEVKVLKLSPVFSWPATPPSLKTFISTITTCREFNNIILNHVKIDHTPFPDVLKIHQKEGIMKIPGPIVPRFLSKIEIDVSFYYLAAGPFWKNPLVIADFHDIGEILVWSNNSSMSMLVPHLEPWLDHHFPAVPYHLEPVRQLGYCVETASFHSCGHHCGSFYVTPSRNHRLHEGEFYLSKVDSIEFRDEDRIPTLIERDLRPATAGQWWLFAPVNYHAPYRWVLINYKARRMYAGPNVSEALVWKGKDVYRMETWARLTSIEDIENFDRN